MVGERLQPLFRHGVDGVRAASAEMYSVSGASGSLVEVLAWSGTSGGQPLPALSGQQPAVALVGFGGHRDTQPVAQVSADSVGDRGVLAADEQRRDTAHYRVLAGLYPSLDASQVGQRQLEEHLFRRQSLLDALADVLVVVTGVLDGVIEDRRTRGQPVTESSSM
jgi:hypothetical protein